MQIAKIPSTVTKCDEAIELTIKALAHCREASIYYGTASVSFSDQGGDSLVHELAECGASGCQEALSLIDILFQDKERVQRSIRHLNSYKARLEETKSHLEACKIKGGNCEQNIPDDAETMVRLSTPAHNQVPRTSSISAFDRLPRLLINRSAQCGLAEPKTWTLLPEPGLPV